MLLCIHSTLTHNVHSGLSGLGAAAVGARDLVLSVIRPHSLLDKQSAVLSLCFHNHMFLVNFSFIFDPFDFRLGSASHHGGKLQWLASLDDDTVLYGGIKFHIWSFWKTQTEMLWVGVFLGRTERLSFLNAKSMQNKSNVFPVNNKTISTLRFYDLDRFSHTRSSRAGIVDCDDTDIIICSFGQTGHGVCQLFTPELCAASPFFLSDQNLWLEIKILTSRFQVKNSQDFQQVILHPRVWYCIHFLYLLNMVSQDVSSTIVQRRLPGHDNGVLPSVHDPWCGWARRHWIGENVRERMNSIEQCLIALYIRMMKSLCSAEHNSWLFEKYILHFVFGVFFGPGIF